VNTLDTSEQGASDRAGGEELFRQDGEVLARLRELAQQIVDRVNKALGEPDTGDLLPPDEPPAAQPAGRA
jgi:hypothetical protein